MIAHQAGKFTLAILAGMLLAQDGLEARGFGGGGRFDLQMPRSGGDFARQGPAYSGGFSSRATPRPESGQQGNRGYSAQPTEVSRSATGQSGQTMSANQQNRQSAMESTTSANQQQRQQYASNYQKQQESYLSNAQESRQDFYKNNEWDSYCHNDSWNSCHYEGGGYAAGAVTGAAVTGAAVTSAAAATSLYRTTAEVVPTGPVLPCTPPQVEQIQGVTYYRCGQSYFVVAYGNAGPTYMPASPPR